MSENLNFLNNVGKAPLKTAFKIQQHIKLYGRGTNMTLEISRHAKMPVRDKYDAHHSLYCTWHRVGRDSH